MNYEIETQLRQFLANRGWDERDIRSAIRYAAACRADTLADAKRAVLREWTPQSARRRIGGTYGS